jgi:hypothetical protein
MEFGTSAEDLGMMVLPSDANRKRYTKPLLALMATHSYRQP